MPRVPTWQQDLAAFEAEEAREVPDRLRACASAGARACLWFTIIDPNDDDEFNTSG